MLNPRKILNTEHFLLTIRELSNILFYVWGGETKTGTRSAKKIYNELAEQVLSCLINQGNHADVCALLQNSGLTQNPNRIEKHQLSAARLIEKFNSCCPVYDHVNERNKNTPIPLLQKRFTEYCHKNGKQAHCLSEPTYWDLPHIEWKDGLYQYIIIGERGQVMKKKLTSNADEVFDWYIDGILHSLKPISYNEEHFQNILGSPVITLYHEFMYCYTLQYQDKHGTFELTIEQNAQKYGWLLWRLDIPRAAEQHNWIIDQIRAYFQYKNLTILDGHRISEVKID